MKHMIKRSFSFLLAVVMVLGMIPAGVIHVPHAHAATDTSKYDLVIDFDYQTENNVKTPEEALELVKDESLSDMSQPVLSRHAYDGDWDELREWLEDPSDTTQIIQLQEDIEKWILPIDDWEAIKITGDKILDLNGYELQIYDRRNGKIGGFAPWGTSEADQNTTVSNHHSYIFQISQGATLTVIDSGGTKEDPGRIYANAIMINHQTWDFLYYTHRDIFHVLDGNLVIYGGEFQAGRQKDQLKSNFSWTKLKNVIGQAVVLGTNILEYTSGISAAEAADLDLKEELFLSKDNKDTEGEDDGKGDKGATDKKTGKDGTKDTKKDTPASAGEQGDKTQQVEQTVAQKQNGKNNGTQDGASKGDQSGKNESSKDKPAKEEGKWTQLAKSEKAIASAKWDKDKIGNMVNSAFDLVEGIAGLFGSDERSRATACIQGTVAKVSNGGTLVIYDGYFIGHGSTPNVRNAVIEVETSNVKNSNPQSLHYGKNTGGYVYVYGGTFDAMTGANVFNMVVTKTNQKQFTYTKDSSGNIVATEVTLPKHETQNMQVLRYDPASLDEWQAGYNAIDASDTEALEAYPNPELVNTANVVVRGGTFRCYYEPIIMSVLKDKAEGGQDPEGSDDDYDHHIFNGTAGAVNLGVASFDQDLIKDGRIQIVDVYGQGKLVLLDGGEPIVPKGEETTGRNESYQTEGGFRQYRLFCGDTELRVSSYLMVYPNDAKTNSSNSMALRTYWGTGDDLSDMWDSATPKEEKEWPADMDNIRAPYSSNEKYIEFVYDDYEDDGDGISANYYVIPNLKNTDPMGSNLNSSNVWYYNVPVDADEEPIVPKVRYFDYDKLMQSGQIVSQDVEYATNIKWFNYKVYRVDPLSRENISENGIPCENEDNPLIEVCYGASPDSLKCKLPLLYLEEQIKARVPGWDGFDSGEMYRIVFSVEEHLAYGFNTESEFDNTMTKASAESSILFLCVSKDELKKETYTNPNTGKDATHYVPDWTPLHFTTDKVMAGETATVNLIEGQTGLVDWVGDKVFDVYYQWWEVDENGNDIRLLAGTDNIWVAQDTVGKNNHRPNNWIIGEDGNGINGELYANTVDPASAAATQYTYFPNGLPKNTANPERSGALWSHEMLHMYTLETTGQNVGLKVRPDETLNMGNNNAFWGNTDSCYIPMDMAGKYLQVRVIAVNCQYPTYYDNKQTYKSHIIPIPGIPNPGFAEVVPAANRDCTSGGQQNLGTMYINEVPAFSFTANELPAAYRDQGYSLKLTTEDYLDGELVGSTTGGAAYTPTGYGSHEVVMKIEVVDSEGNCFSALKYRYNFNIKFRPLITGAYYTVQVEGRQTKTDLTAEQFEARYADLGHFSDTVFVQIRAEDLPQSMKDQGYYMQLNVVDEVDGEVVLSKSLGGGYLFNSVGYCPDAVGNHTIKLKAVMLDSNGNLVECSETVTFDLSLTLDFGMYNIKPAPSEADLAAGVTDLGTINSRMFSFMYRPPTWALSYNIEAKIYDYVNGVLDSSNRSTLTHKLGDYINDMTGTYTVDFYPKGVGRHEVHMLLRLTDDSGNEVMEQEHVFNFQYVTEQPTGIDIGSYPTGITLSQGQTHALSWYVAPTATAEQKAVFTSSNPEIASVSSSGVITGGSRTGTVTITASTPCGGYSKTVKVKVNATSTPVAVAGIGLRVGEYLQSGSTTPTTVKPEDKYVYLSRVDGVLTLTMHNYVVRDNNVHYFHHADVSVGGDYTYAQIVANEYVNIVVEGDNLLKVKSSTYTGAGIFLFQGGQISGSGTLAIDNFNCIEVLDSDFTLSGAKLTLTASYQGIHGITSYNSSVDTSVTLSSGSITAETDYDAICADNVTISNGTYDLKSDSGNGIYAIGGTIAIKAGTIDINAYKNGIDGTTVTISGGTTNVTAKKRGIDADTVTISGGTTWCKGCVRGVSTYKMDVTAGALYAEGSEYGIYAPYAYMTSYGGLDITGGSVLAKCTDTTGSSYCYAIDSSNYTPTLTGTYQFGATNGSGAGYTTLDASNLTGYDFVFVGEQPLYFSVWLNNRWLWDGCRIGRSTSSMEAATEPKVDTAYYKDGVLQLMGFDPVYGELKFGTRTLTIDMVDGYYNNLETITCSASYGLIIKGDAYLNVNMFADYDEGIRARGVTILDSAFVDVRASGTCIAACRSLTVNDGVLYLTGEGDSTIGITGYSRQGGTVSVKDGFLVSSGTNHSALGSTVSLSSSCNVDVRVGTNSSSTSTWDGTTSLSSYGYLSVDHAHTWSYVEPVAPTCVTDGSEGYYICTGCGRYFEMAHESWEFDDLTEIIIPATGHTMVDATCTLAEYCSVCMYSEGEPNGHDWIDATCAEPQHCADCGEITGDALEHTLDEGVVTTEATCCEDGVLTYTCSVCGGTETEVIPADPNFHKFDIAATCDEAVKCSLCGDYSGYALGHQWEAATCTAPKTCSVCHATEGSALGHDWAEATCTTPKRCASCGITDGSELGHSWIDATCTEPKTCDRCMLTDGAPLGHTWDVSDCTQARTCTVCGETAEAGVHTLTTDDLRHQGTCESCGMTIASELHTFGDDDFCDICGHEVKLVELVELKLDKHACGKHPDMTVEIVNEDGTFTAQVDYWYNVHQPSEKYYEDYTFTCGKAYGAYITVNMPTGYRFERGKTVIKVNNGNAITGFASASMKSASFRVFNSWIGVAHRSEVEATCTTDGCLAHYYCPTCGKTYATASGSTPISAEELIIPALGHNMVDGTCTRCGYTEAVGGPQIVSQPVDYVGMVGDNATFTVVAEGEGLTYQWYYYDTAAASWKKSSGGTSATLSVVFAAYRNNQEYRCEITDMDGNTVTTDTVKLVAKEMELVIVTQPVDYVGSVNDNLSFTVEATGNGLTYQWYYSDNAGATWKISGTPGFDTATLLPILRAYRDGYQYYCKITDIFGNTVSSDVVSATVRSSEIVISQQPVAVTDGVLDQLHTFKVTASGDNLEYRWEYSDDGGETWQLSWNQGYNADTLTVRLYAYRSGYLYRCKIVSGLKTVVYTEPVELTLQAPSATIVKQPANVAVVTGKTASFPVQATGTNLTYQWYRSNDNGATWTKTYLGGYNTAALSFVANASRAALYKCQITDGSGKTIWSNVVKLQILSAELKILTQPSNVTCANGATATFTVEAQGDTLKYQWYSSADGGTTWTASYLTGYNTNTFSFAVNASRAARLYKCVITDAGGNTVETNAVSVTIG